MLTRRETATEMLGILRQIVAAVTVEDLVALRGECLPVIDRAAGVWEVPRGRPKGKTDTVPRKGRADFRALKEYQKRFGPLPK